MSEFVDVHSCVKHDDIVNIIADVVETRRGKSVRLIAHNKDCKVYSKKASIQRKYAHD